MDNFVPNMILNKDLSEKPTASERKPKKWKMLLLSWLFVYPVVNILFVFLMPFIQEYHPLLKTFVLTILLVPIMGLSIPLIHKKFWDWIVK
jgi:antibiotic biosynthesis monooxygenase (ABM) superfamily enzyme